MRGADTFTESLFTLRRLEDFVPARHPLRPIREMVNQALKDIEPLLSGIERLCSDIHWLYIKNDALNGRG